MNKRTVLLISGGVILVILFAVVANRISSQYPQSSASLLDSIISLLTQSKKPDLVVTDIMLVHVDPPPPGREYPVYAFISNLGEKRSRPTKAELIVRPSGTTITPATSTLPTWDIFFEVEALRPGDLWQPRPREIFFLDWLPPIAWLRPPPVKYYGRLCVDPENIVKELDETNNCREERF